MPITPFHFGPGAALHSAAPERVSFITFCVANVLVDVEPLYYMVTGQFPLHRFFHTYVGVSFVVVAATAFMVAMLKLGSLIPLPNLFGWKQLTFKQISIGAAIGGYSHVALDSIMHSDIRPFAPFSESNVLLHVVSLGILHLSCLAAGLVGLVVLGIRKVLREENAL